MLYALLIYQAEEVAENYSDEEDKQALVHHHALQDDAKAAGHLVETNRLLPSSSATTVRTRNGRVMVTDGPFTETKELLVGLYVLDCETLEQAIEYAARIPISEAGGIEVRPVAFFENVEGSPG